MKETPWTRHIADAEECRLMAEKYRDMGHVRLETYWHRIRHEKLMDARKARRKQEPEFNE